MMAKARGSPAHIVGGGEEQEDEGKFNRLIPHGFNIKVSVPFYLRTDFSSFQRDENHSLTHFIVCGITAIRRSIRIPQPDSVLG